MRRRSTPSATSLRTYASPPSERSVSSIGASFHCAPASKGRVRTCALHTESLETIEAWLAAQREIWERRFDRLELYVEKLKKEEKSNASK